jgi:hypothetical protein
MQGQSLEESAGQTDASERNFELASELVTEATGASSISVIRLLRLEF